MGDSHFPTRSNGRESRLCCVACVLGRLCGEAVLRGADVFAAGVISASAGITPGTPVIILTDLDMVRFQLSLLCFTPSYGPLDRNLYASLCLSSFLYDDG